MSAAGQLKMLRIIKELVDQNSQFIIATHSPMLSSFPNATIYELVDDELVKRNYEDTDNYVITKYFLNNTLRMLDELFGE